MFLLEELGVPSIWDNASSRDKSAFRLIAICSRTSPGSLSPMETLHSPIEDLFSKGLS